MDWKTIVPLVLGSSLLSALITYFLNFLMKEKETRKHNSYVALVIAHDLENYALECGSIVSDHDMLEDSRGAAGKLAHEPPSSFNIPKQDYRSFDHNILDRLLTFPKQIKSAKSHIDFDYGLVSDEEASETAHKEILGLGLEALSLSRTLRKRYGLAKNSPKLGVLDLGEYLNKRSTEQGAAPNALQSQAPSEHLRA